MSNVREFNQSNPFWDWLSSQVDPTNSSHHFANAYNPRSRDSRGAPPEYSWQPHPDQHDGPPAPHPEGTPPHHNEGPTPPPPPPPGPHAHHGPRPHYPHAHPFGPGFPFGGHPGHQGYARSRAGCAGRGPWNPAAAGFDMSKLAQIIGKFVPEDVLGGLARDFTATPTATATATGAENDKDGTSNDFVPAADIFDTPDAYVVHISLPGAKKEDVGVNWDADKSELNVAGVIYRPGNEEFLKTLALDERRVGVFERKVKLGSKAHPANVDSEAIGAKMEHGVLMVTIPKNEEFVEVKKVDIE